MSANETNRGEGVLHLERGELKELLGLRELEEQLVLGERVSDSSSESVMLRGLASSMALACNE